MSSPALDLAFAPADLADPLRCLGLHGLSSIATPVLAGLVTGDPVLLVGPHGTAKTALCEALAEALGLRFKAYDASKALFEDIVGFPDPSGLAEGTVRYVPTEVSIWGTELVLVDELSRASPAMQNKWLEVVRSRRVMGVPVDTLRHVFAAMNPPGYLGARPLDPALVGRFGFVVQVPGVDRMSPAEVDRVIRTVGASDAPACPGAWPGADARAGGDVVGALVAEARRRLPQVLARHEPALVSYVREVASRLRGDGVALDGRRLALCFRGLAAGLAVEAARGEAEPDERLLHGLLVHTLPGAALERAEPAHAVFAAHVHGYEAAFGREGADAGLLDRHRRAAMVLGHVDPLHTVEAYAQALDALNEEEHHEVVSRVLRHLREGGADKVPPARAVLAVHRLLGLVVSHHRDLPLDVVSRVMVGWQAVAGLRAGRWEDLHDLLHADDGLPEAPHAAADWLACRIAIELSRSEPGDPDQRPDSSKASALREPLRNTLRALSSEQP